MSTVQYLIGALRLRPIIVLLNSVNNWTVKSIAVIFLLNVTHGINNPLISQNRDAQIWNSAIIDWNFTQGWLVELELDYNRLLSEGPVW